MNAIQHFDMATEILDDGTIRLTQTDYSGDESVIDLHPAQLRLLADQFAAKPDRLNESITRRLLELQSDVRYFTDGEMWVDEIANRVGDGLAFQIGANAMRYALDGIIADLGLIPLDAWRNEEPTVPPKQSDRAPQQPVQGALI